MTDYLDRAENEIARLYAENTNLRTENSQLKNEMMSREIERLTGDRFEFHGELGDKVPALTRDEASLLVLRGALHAATAEVGKLRAALEPFARKFDAESLFIALAHITREDLQRASDALGGKREGEP